MQLSTFQSDINEFAHDSSSLNDDELFHNLLHDFLNQNGMKTLSNLETFASLTSSYSHSINEKYQNLKKDYDRKEISRIMNTNNTFNQSIGGFQANNSNNNAELNQLINYKAERDFWSLLQYLSASDLLNNINEKQSADLLEKALQDLSIHATIPEHINTAYIADERLRKGAVLMEWLENCSLDSIVSIPKPLNEPLTESLLSLQKQQQQQQSKKNPTSASFPGTDYQNTSLNPDLQLSKDGKMLLLPSSNDQMDQERLWKAIWSLIRAGKLSEAQQLAIDHHIYWFASTLRGGEYHYYEKISEEELKESHSAVVSPDQLYRRLGNPQQPLWLQTCWNYVDFLAKNPENWKLNFKNLETLTKDIMSSSSSASTHASSSTGAPNNDSNNGLTGILEMTIFASLSNHVDVLLKSPLLSSYLDKIWVFLKAIHTHNIMLIVSNYRKQKYSMDANYLGCDLPMIEIEEKMISLLEFSLQSLISDHSNMEIVFVDNYKELLYKILHNPKGQYLYQQYHLMTQNHNSSNNQINLELFLVHFMTGIIEGKSGLQSFIQFLLSAQETLMTNNEDEATMDEKEKSILSIVGSATFISKFFDCFPAMNKNTILRMMTHFMIWSKVFGNFDENGHADEFHNNQFSAVIPYTVYYPTIQSYIHELMTKKLFHCIPLYCRFLNSASVIENYSLLFLLLNKLFITEKNRNSNQNEDEEHQPEDPHPSNYLEIFLLSKEYFPNLMIEVIRKNFDILYSKNEKQSLKLFQSFFGFEGDRDQFAGLDQSSIMKDNQNDSMSFSKFSLSGLQNNPRSSTTAPSIRSTPFRSKQNNLVITPFTDKKAGGSMLFQSPVASSYSTPSMTTEDLMLMENFYWLSLDSDYSLELIKQTNRMVLYFFDSSSSASSNFSGFQSSFFSVTKKLDYLIEHYLPIQLTNIGNEIQLVNFQKLQNYLMTSYEQLHSSSQAGQVNYSENEMIYKVNELYSLMKVIYLEYNSWVIHNWKLLMTTVFIQQQNMYSSAYLPQLNALTAKTFPSASNSLLGSSSIQLLSIQKDMLGFISTTKEYLTLLKSFFNFQCNLEMEEMNSLMINEQNNWKKKTYLLFSPFLQQLSKAQQQKKLSLDCFEENHLFLGWNDLFAESNRCSLSFIDSLFVNILDVVMNQSSQMNGEENDDSVMSNGNDEKEFTNENDFKEIHNSILRTQIIDWMEKLIPFFSSSSSSTSLTTVCYSEYSSQFQTIQNNFVVLSHYFLEKKFFLNQFSEEVLLSIVHQLREAYYYCVDMKREFVWKENMLFHLLFRYIQVSTLVRVSLCFFLILLHFFSPIRFVTKVDSCCSLWKIIKKPWNCILWGSKCRN
jgi:hypothetical protein